MNQPTTPGVYRYSKKTKDGVMIEFMEAYTSERGQLRARPITMRDDCPGSALVSDLPGHWEKVELGEPHKFRQPPKVELWEGERDGHEFLLKLPSSDCKYVSVDRCGRYVAGEDYTNLRKVGEYVLKEET